MSDASTPATPPTPSLQRLGAAALGLVHGHVELFGIELQEQKERSLQALILTGMALIAGLLLLLGLSALLLVLAGEAYRLHAILSLCLVYSLAFLLCVWRLRRLQCNPLPPFSATLAELARDRERLLP
ncbi:MAG: hypothetical protein CFE49_18500 [Pseudomonas sp. PGPPP3]|nr:MAG: hypothetical protein CFE49_18500 [Pseudomonas sp. PGPPP3]